MTIDKIIIMVNARVEKASAEFDNKPSEYLAGKIDALVELSIHLQEWLEYQASYEED